jgi:hypothetical protein
MLNAQLKLSYARIARDRIQVARYMLIRTFRASAHISSDWLTAADPVASIDETGTCRLNANELSRRLL